MFSLPSFWLPSSRSNGPPKPGSMEFWPVVQSCLTKWRIDSEVQRKLQTFEYNIFDHGMTLYGSAHVPDIVIVLGGPHGHLHYAPPSSEANKARPRKALRSSAPESSTTCQRMEENLIEKHEKRKLVLLCLSLWKTLLPTDSVLWWYVELSMKKETHLLLEVYSEPIPRRRSHEVLTLQTHDFLALVPATLTHKEGETFLHTARLPQKAKVTKVPHISLNLPLFELQVVLRFVCPRPRTKQVFRSQ